MYNVLQVYRISCDPIGIILKFDYDIRVIVSWLGNEKRPESVS